MKTLKCESLRSAFWKNFHFSGKPSYITDRNFLFQNNVTWHWYALQLNYRWKLLKVFAFFTWFTDLPPTASSRPVLAYGFSVVNVLGKFRNFYGSLELYKLLLLCRWSDCCNGMTLLFSSRKSKCHSNSFEAWIGSISVVDIL